MILGIETMALAVTDLRFVSRAAQQIVSPLAATNSKLVKSSAPVNPDEVKAALDKTAVAIASVERKLAECSDIIRALDDPEINGLEFTNDFPNELKSRAEILTYHIENLNNVFSLVEDSASWKPYLPLVQERKMKAIRAIANLRNAYLNIALMAEQYVSSIPTVDSIVEGSADEFAEASAASLRLLSMNQSEWC